MKTKHFYESVTLSLPAMSEENYNVANEALLEHSGAALEVEFAAIHAGLTRNNTFYTKEGLTNVAKNEHGQPGGLKSWLEPYPAPLIRDHDKSDADKVMGRVIETNWVEKEGKEPGHVSLKFKVTNPEAIGKFMRGEYLTGSVGQEVDSARCSICNLDMVESEGMCEHTPGKYYAKATAGSEAETNWVEAKPMQKGAKRAYVIMGNVWGREYSVVTSPSDPKSKVKNIAHVTEMALLDEEDNTLMTIIGKTINEAEVETEETPEVVVPEAEVVAEETTQEVPESTEVVPEIEAVEESDLSIAEMLNYFRRHLEASSEYADPLSFYFELCASLQCSLLDLKPGSNMPMPLGTTYAYYEKEDDSEPKILRYLKSSELKSLIKYIEDTNEDLEIELKELKDAVLFSEERNKLPDSAFALVKSVDGKNLRALPYKYEDGSVDKAQLRNALARWNQVKGFSIAEKAKALRKLRTVAARVGIGPQENTAIEAPADVTAITSENEQLQIQVAELLRQVSEKDAHIDILTEKLGNGKVETVEAEIEVPEEVPESTEETTVVEQVENQGLPLETSTDESAQADGPPPELVWRGLLGIPGARRELAKYNKQILSKKS